MMNAYTIVGGGAIGGTLAAYLVEGGAEVVIIDADHDHVAALRERGITIQRPDGELVVRVTAYHLDEAPERLEAVILAVKAQATDSAAAWIAPRLSDHGWVVSAQNGLNEATIAKHVGAERTVACFVDLFADVIAPGVIQDGGIGAMAIGEYTGGSSERIESLVHDLRLWGTPVISDNVEGFLWSKLAFGSMLIATALADEDMSVLIDRHRGLMAELAAEVLELTDAMGIHPEPFDAFVPSAYRATADQAETDAATDGLVAWLATQTKTRSGIWRDLAVRKRPTEVPAQFRAMLAFGEQHSMRMPKIRRLMELIQAIEQGEPMAETHIEELAKVK
ncbi:ketopantoate reductase family protein [Leucobacter chinensis]|uniref:ketopantoate reductase family protein n=1 Tax=Leucobacter chinensis TaxID=2851010 RepID=UPI001C21A3D4|nr:2-dehydropantoate 2-reductase [Leucobacter chinensis]